MGQLGNTVGGEDLDQATHRVQGHGDKNIPTLHMLIHAGHWVQYTQDMLNTPLFGQIFPTLALSFIYPGCTYLKGNILSLGLNKEIENALICCV